MFSPTVEAVVGLQKKRNERNENLKLKLLNQVKTKIGNYANFGRTECFIQIPSFQFGEPQYKVKDITRHIYRKLSNEGFIVKKINDECLYINWDMNKITEHLNSKIKKKEEEIFKFAGITNNNKII